jgi:hypothetical protein
MNKPTRILRSIAFVVLAVISVALFDVFTAWAISRLDPIAQETVGLANAPWTAVHPVRRTTTLDGSGMVGEARASDAAMDSR